MAIKSDMAEKYRAGILRLLLCLIVVTGVYIFDYHCPFLAYFHIPCLGCGMSRSWKSIIHGQWKEAYEYHKAFWTVPIICFFIFKGSLFKKLIWNIIILGVILFGFIINYIYHFI